jgi:uncharacterized coiled-coil DUF342 family protein
MQIPNILLRKSKLLTFPQNNNSILLNKSEQPLSERQRQQQQEQNQQSSWSQPRGPQLHLTLQKLIEEKRQAIDNIKKTGDKFTNLSNEISKISKTINSEQKELDTLFVVVKGINQRIEEQREKLAELFQKREKAIPLLQNESKLIKQLKGVEFKLQTSRLNRNEEKQLVSVAKDIAKRIQEIRSQYSKEEKDSSSFSISNIVRSIEAVKQNIIQIQQNNKTEVDKKIDQKRAAIKELVDERQRVFNEKDILKNELAQMIDKLSNTYKKIKEVRIALKQNNRNDRRLSNYPSYNKRPKDNSYNNAIIEKIREEAQKKLDSGRKVSFDELRILYGK